MEPELTKLLRRLHKVDARIKQHKKFTGFSRMSVMANLLCFESFSAG